MEPSDATRMNNELMAAADGKKDDEAAKDAKRNTKQALIQNILKVVEKYQLDFDYSDTKLRRMNKEQLTKLLAGVMEQCVKIDMAKSVGVDPRAGGKVVTLGALRMIHNIAAVGFEKAWNSFLAPSVGVETHGFSSSLKDPSIQGTVDECLAEIAAENPEVLEYFDSPYSRLAIVWAGALMTTMRKCQQGNKRTKNGFPNMGPRKSARTPAGGDRSGGGAPLRQKHGDDEHRVQAV